MTFMSSVSSDEVEGLNVDERVSDLISRQDTVGNSCGGSSTACLEVANSSWKRQVIVGSQQCAGG